MGRAAGGGYDVVVIGGGHNGLVSAAYLARAGMRTLLLERRERVGGALETMEVAPGVRAPVGVHTVGRLNAAVARDLRLARHGLRLLRPAVRVCAPLLDGTALTLWGDVGRTVEELRARSPEDAESFARLDRKVRSIASFLAHLNATIPPDTSARSLRDALTAVRLGRALRRLGPPETVRETLRVLPMSVADFVEEIESDSLRAALMSRGVLYTAMGPRSAGTAAVLLQDSAGNDGGAAGQSVLAAGGPGAVAAALESAATSLGVEVRTNAHVTKILATPDRVQGVILSSGDEVSAPWVVSGADPKTTLLSLMDADVVGPTLRWRAGNIRTNGTLAKVNLLLEDLPPFRGVDDVERLRGRVLLGPDPDYLERAFDASKYGNLPDRPLIELTIPTLSDPSLAPQGTHVVSALVQWVPHPSARRGPAPRPPVDREAVADVVLATLDEHGPGLSSRVLARHVMTPLDLEQEYGLAGGHPLHADPGLDQIFAWRPLLGHASYRLAVPGLYLCGSGAHPGGGITGIPGANAARRLMEDVRGGKARSAS